MNVTDIQSTLPMYVNMSFENAKLIHQAWNAFDLAYVSPHLVLNHKAWDETRQQTDIADKRIPTLPDPSNIRSRLQLPQDLGFGIRYPSLCGLYPLSEIGVLRD